MKPNFKNEGMRDGTNNEERVLKASSRYLEDIYNDEEAEGRLLVDRSGCPKELFFFGRFS